MYWRRSVKALLVAKASAAALSKVAKPSGHCIYIYMSYLKIGCRTLVVFRIESILRIFTSPDHVCRWLCLHRIGCVTGFLGAGFNRFSGRVTLAWPSLKTKFPVCWNLNAGACRHLKLRPTAVNNETKKRLEKHTTCIKRRVYFCTLWNKENILT